MTTAKTIPNVDRTHHPALTFVLWIVATYAGGVLYFIPVGVVHLVLGLDRFADDPSTAELTTWMRVLAAVLCGVACGSTIALAQWLVLRRESKRMGWWVAATVAGYASIGLLILIASVFQPGWLNWATTLIISGKMHWLARLEPSWPAASWPPGALTLTLFGIVLGISQWLVLRTHVRRAGWWIAISAGGWALAALLSAQGGATAVFASWEIPMLVAAIGLVWLLRRPAPVVPAPA